MAVNSLGCYYNKYMDNVFTLPHIDYRKDNTLTDNNMATIYGKKNSPAYETQLTGQYQFKDNTGSDKNEYVNSWNVMIKPKPYVNILGAKLLT
jgi:hypothetical protein